MPVAFTHCTGSWHQVLSHNCIWLSLDSRVMAGPVLYSHRRLDGKGPEMLPDYLTTRLRACGDWGKPHGGVMLSRGVIVINPEQLSVDAGCSS